MISTEKIKIKRDLALEWIQDRRPSNLLINNSTKVELIDCTNNPFEAATNLFEAKTISPYFK
jgi:hypothetical protein